MQKHQSKVLSFYDFPKKFRLTCLERNLKTFFLVGTNQAFYKQLSWFLSNKIEVESCSSLKQHLKWCETINIVEPLHAGIFRADVSLAKYISKVRLKDFVIQQSRTFVGFFESPGKWHLTRLTISYFFHFLDLFSKSTFSDTSATFSVQPLLNIWDKIFPRLGFAKPNQRNGLALQRK